MYKITLEDDDDTVLVTVNTLQEASQWIKNKLFTDFDKHANFDGTDTELMKDMDDTFNEGSPWCLYLDETGLPMRYNIFKDNIINIK